jgi:hypothetical protein
MVMNKQHVAPASSVPPSAASPVTVVSRAPEPTVDRIEELAGRILRGDILLPKFQRDFVWEKHQIIDLLDSIANNYPIGSVLLWRSREVLRSERSIADLEIAPTQHDYPVNYLLDGQQRLSTICGALYWQGGDPNSRWNLAFNLRDKTFSHLETLDDPPLHLLRLNKLRDPSAYFKHVSSLDTLTATDVTSLVANAKELFDRFKDYKVATVTLHEMSIQAVAPIFERINSRGSFPDLLGFVAILSLPSRSRDGLCTAQSPAFPLRAASEAQAFPARVALPSSAAPASAPG